MIQISDVKVWADKRLENHRAELEALITNDDRTIGLRHRIAELKELLAALRNDVPPVWIDAS